MALKTPTTNLAVLATHIEHLREDQDAIKTSIAEINDTLKVLGSIEQRQIGVVRDLGRVADNKVEIDKRVSEIEKELPQLREMRTWVIKGVSAGVGMLFLGIVSLVGNVLIDRIKTPTYVQLGTISQAPVLPGP